MKPAKPITGVSRAKLKRIAIGFSPETFKELVGIANNQGTNVSSLVAGMVELWIRK